jgi:hypothetical protein
MVYISHSRSGASLRRRGRLDRPPSEQEAIVPPEHISQQGSINKKNYATSGLFILKSRIVSMTGNALDEQNYASDNKP